MLVKDSLPGTPATGVVSSRPPVHHFQLHAAVQPRSWAGTKLRHALISWQNETHPKIIQFPALCEGLAQLILNDPAIVTYLDGGKFS